MLKVTNIAKLFIFTFLDLETISDHKKVYYMKVKVCRILSQVNALHSELEGSWFKLH